MKVKGLVSGALAAIMTVSLLAGCGEGEDSKSSASSQQVESKGQSGEKDVTGDSGNEKSYDKKITIEIVENTEVTDDIDDFVAKVLEEKFNIEIKTVKLPEYASQLNIRLAGGNIPDIFLIPNRNNLADMVRNEYVLELTPYLDQLQTTVDFVSNGSGVMTSGISGDGVYAIPKKERIHSPLPNSALMIRKDWLEKLDLPMPQNYEELFETAKAFAENDPDGNGVDDTYGYMGEWGVQALAPLMANFQCTAQVTLYVEDGEVKTTLQNENMKEALRQAKTWFDAGIVDPDIILNASLGNSATVQQCKVGIMYSNWADGWRIEATQKYAMVDPECEWEWIPVFEGEDHNPLYVGVGGSNLFGINPELPEKDPEKLERIFDLFNFVSSEEGQRLVCYGREGIEYTMEGDKIVVTTDPDIVADAGFVWAYQISGRDDEQYLRTKFAYCEEQLDQLFKRESIPAYGGLVLTPEDVNLADMNTYVSEEMWKFIYGNRDIEEYDDFLKTLYDVYNLSGYLKSAQEQLKELKVIE